MLTANLDCCVGIDLVDIKRLKKALARRGPTFHEMIYTPQEWRIYGGDIQRLAVRFAAKEAVAKALGVGFVQLHVDGIAPNDVEILTEQSSGQPHLQLHGTARQKAIDLGVSRWRLSLSHTACYAMAMVIGLMLDSTKTDEG